MSFVSGHKTMMMMMMMMLMMKTKHIVSTAAIGDGQRHKK